MTFPLEAGDAPTSASATYRPISVLAIVGLGLGLVSCLIFAVDAYWFLLFVSVPAFLISLIALRRIRRSEGTLAGERVASTGIIFSLISGLGWTTSYLTTYGIIRQESSRFVNGWLDKLRQGKSVESFLDTKSPLNRHLGFPLEDLPKLRARFPPKEGYDPYRHALLINLALRYGERLEWEPGGVAGWGYSDRAYHVIYRYHLRCPEYQGEVRILTASMSTNAADAPPRSWFVNLQYSDTSALQLTPYGKELKEVQRAAVDRIDKWLLEFTVKPVQRGGLRAGSLLTFLPTENVLWSLGAAAIAAEHGPGEAGRQGNDPSAQEPEFEKLRAALSRESGWIPVTQPILVKDRKDDAWELTYELVLRSGTTTLDFQVTAREDPISHQWQITSGKLLGPTSKN
jgi:hypothetical protein